MIRHLQFYFGPSNVIRWFVIELKVPTRSIKFRRLSTDGADHQTQPNRKNGIFGRIRLRCRQLGHFSLCDPLDHWPPVAGIHGNWPPNWTYHLSGSIWWFSLAHPAAPPNRRRSHSPISVSYKIQKFPKFPKHLLSSSTPSVDDWKN